MPMDDYDFTHKANYEYIINIYSNTNIDVAVNNFLEQTKFQLQDQYIKEIKDKIIYMNCSLKILDNRHITNIGARIIFYINNTPIWILVQVWRGGSQFLNNKII